MLDAEQINELCDTAERILREEPSVLRLNGASSPLPPPDPPFACACTNKIESPNFT